MIYAFDVSLNNTGLVIFNDVGEIEFVTSIDTHNESNHQAKLKLIAERLLEIRKTYKADLVVFERGFYRFAASTEAIYKVFGVIQYIFNDVKQEFYPPMTVKKAVSGRGNNKKEAVKDAIVSLFPHIHFKNLDESDAAAVGVCYFNLRDQK